MTADLDIQWHKRAVVTGCAGFIGSHLTERLLAEGWQVLGIDCFTDFYDHDMKVANLARAAGEEKIIRSRHPGTRSGLEGQAGLRRRVRTPAAPARPPAARPRARTIA